MKRSLSKPISPKNHDIDAVAIFKRANAEWEKGCDEKAFKLFLAAASLGGPSAQHNVSAMSWWRKAISLGDGEAMLDLAKFYLSKGGMRNRTQARSLLRKVKASRRVTEDAIEEAAKLLKSQSQETS